MSYRIKNKILILEKEFFDLNNIPKNIYCDFYNQKTSNFKDYMILAVRLKYKIDDKFLKKFKNLKFIITFTTGLDHIDQIYCKKNNIIIFSLRNIKKVLNQVSSAAEHAWMLTLLTIRKFHQVQFDKRDLPVGLQLMNKKIGIIGLGRIGKKIAKYSKAFSMDVYYNDIKKLNKINDYKFKNLDQILIKCNIILVAVTADEKNRNLINKDLINLMNSNSILINISRDWIVDEIELLKKIKKKEIYGYGADFINKKNLKSIFSTSNISKINRSHNIILTDHAGGNNLDAIKYVEKKLFYQFFLKYFRININSC